MTTPTVTETPRLLEATGPDPFLESPWPALPVADPLAAGPGERPRPTQT